jgi:RNA polymerase sigma-70 factor (ECF subfamily)
MHSPGSDDLARLRADTVHLAAELRAGDLQRFRELYERLAPSLHAWARVQSRPAQALSLDPEDLLQEVWMRAIERLSTFDGTRGSFRSWIFGIAKNIGYEVWSKRQTAATIANCGSTSDAAGASAWPDVATSIRTRLAKDESSRLLVEFLTKFDPVDRLMLVHCGMEGIPCTTVAPRLGLSVEAATKRWQRLRARLKEQSFADLLEV